MANDKDFVVAGAVEVGKDTKVTLGTVTSNNIDLATGNYFADTPTSASTYTISNAGDVQSFQLEVTGGTAEVAQNFSTTLYTGTNATNSIDNGVDLANDGGLVWIKSRNSNNTSAHYLYDTERGINTPLSSNTTGGDYTAAEYLTSFDTTGFTLGNQDANNSSVDNFVSWAFKKEPSFFDVVTYTGNTVAGRLVPHSLGSVPACIIIKRLETDEGWFVYHRGMDATAPENYYLQLNTTAARVDGTIWNDTAPTSTDFVLDADSAVNGSGETYVAYLFAHDDAADGLIQCGSYTGTGVEQVINLGWQAQWVLIKNASNSAGWYLVDLERGMTDTDQDGFLYANASTAEGNEASNLGENAHSTDPNGFKVTSNGTQVNFDGGDTYIYIAIRAASDPDITWPSSIEWAGGIAPSAPAVGETDVYTLVTDDGGTSYVGVKTADNLS